MHRDPPEHANTLALDNERENEAFILPPGESAWMQGMRLPSTLDEITAPWLTAALRIWHPGVTVEAVGIEQVLHGTATKAKLALQYDPAGRAAGLPAVLWIKAGFEAHFVLMGPIGIYRTEGRFYRDIRRQVPVTAPEPFYAQFDHETGQGIVLLEDLGAPGVRFGSFGTAATVDMVAAQLENFARLHAFWWGATALDTLGLEVPSSPGSGPDRYYRAQTPAVVEGFLGRPRALAVPGSLRDAKRIIDAYFALQRVGHAGSHVLLHGDAHLGNSYYLPDGRAGMYDWQTIMRGCWAHDVSYFVGSALEPAVRRRAERDLLRHYLECLRAAGAPAPSFDTAWLDYRRFMAYGFIAWLTNPETFQPEVNNTVTTARYSQACEDLETYEILGV
ncbi:MAG: phosphotransferase [Gammaproteobacteria bacterium]